MIKGARIDHLPGDHDDFANAVAGAHVAAQRGVEDPPIVMPIIFSGGSEIVASASAPGRPPAHYLKHGGEPWRPYVDVNSDMTWYAARRWGPVGNG